MDTPKLDRRDRHDILEQLRALAASYVPEWRWDDREPDVGVILAHLYAAMMENTISLYNRSMHNHYLAFLNLLGTRLLPPSPAEGMISVGVTPGSEGVYIDRGTAVYAAAETDSGRVFYETTEAVRALDTELDRVFFTSAARDTIVCAYTRGGEEAPIRLFGFDAYPQLQRHILYFRDDAVFYTKDRTDLTLTLAHSRSAKQSEVLQRVFSDPETVSWEYHSGDGVWHTMDRVTRTAEGIRLEGDQGSQPVESEQEGAMGLLRCRLKKIPTGGLYLTDVGWTAEAYLAEGGFFWNAGIFVWNAETVSVQMRRFAPQIAGIMDELAPSFYSDREAAELSRLFPRCDRISIDYAVMERSDDIYVIPDNPGWSDLGSWGAVRSHMAQDAAGNASVGEDVRLFGCSNCIVHAEGGGTVVAEGLDGYIIARRGDNMLVCRLSEEQRIKEFSALKK